MISIILIILVLYLSFTSALIPTGDLCKTAFEALGVGYGFSGIASCLGVSVSGIGCGVCLHSVVTSGQMWHCYQSSSCNAGGDSYIKTPQQIGTHVIAIAKATNLFTSATADVACTTIGNLFSQGSSTCDNCLIASQAVGYNGFAGCAFSAGVCLPLSAATLSSSYLGVCSITGSTTVTNTDVIMQAISNLPNIQFNPTSSSFTGTVQVLFHSIREYSNINTFWSSPIILQNNLPTPMTTVANSFLTGGPSSVPTTLTGYFNELNSATTSFSINYQSTTSSGSKFTIDIANWPRASSNNKISICYKLTPVTGVVCNGDKTVTITSGDLSITSDWTSTINSDGLTSKVNISCATDPTTSDKLVCLEFDAFTHLTYDPSFTILISGSGSTAPQPCVTSAWSDWSGCSVLCGVGQQTRDRTYVSGDCTGTSYHESQSCTVNCNCVVGAWSEWSNCSATCGGGTQTKTREVVTPATNGGTCDDVLSDSQSCNTQTCPVGTADVDCSSHWSSFTSCSATCGGGTQTQTAIIDTPKSGNGKDCSPLSQTQSCNTQPCDSLQVCKVSDWSKWVCGASCGSTTQTRSREVTQAGLTCDIPLTESKPCELGSCGSSMLQTAVPVAPTIALVSLSAGSILFFAIYRTVQRVRINGKKDIELNPI